MAVKLDLWDVIDADAVADYLCADHGSYFGVYPDGTYSVGQDVGMEIDPGERPLFRVRCPGLGNVDSTWWAEGVEGAADMDTEDLVRLGCAEGDVSGEVEDLIRRLEGARKSGYGNETHGEGMAMATETVYVVRDAAGEYVSDAAGEGRTPASDEAHEFATAALARAACGRTTDRVLVRDGG